MLPFYCSLPRIQSKYCRLLSVFETQKLLHIKSSVFSELVKTLSNTLGTSIICILSLIIMTKFPPKIRKGCAGLHLTKKKKKKKNHKRILLLHMWRNPFLVSFITYNSVRYTSEKKQR